MNATPPVGPLDGATYARPDGWLPNPLTTDPRQAQAQARALLTRHHDGHRSLPVTACLSARYRTATFTLGQPPRLLLKRHADQAAYLGEVLAYQLLADDHVLPTLHDARDESQILIVDYLPTRADLREIDTFAELITAVATVHTASARWGTAISEVMASWQLRHASTVPDWIPRPRAWHRVLALTAAAHGHRHVPLGHLDLKADHARRHDGRLVIIDAETLRPDLTGLSDLITLAWLAQQLHVPMTGRDIRHAYRREVNDLGANWSDPRLTAALHAFAEATGLYRLHDVAS